MKDHKSSIIESLKFEPTNAAFADVLGDKNLIAYGAGGAFITLWLMLKRFHLEHKLSAILDVRFKSGDTYYGIPAYSPYEYTLSKEKADCTLALITTAKYNEMFKHLHDIGINNIMYAFDIFEYNCVYVDKHILDTGNEFYNQNGDNILSTIDLLADDMSKEVYANFVNTYIQHRVIKLPTSPENEEYFPNDIKLNRGPDRFIDCGAYVGDTLSKFAKVHGKVSKIACYEPDAENFSTLTKYANKSDLADTVILFPCGVYDSECKLNFAGNDGIASTITKSGTGMIQCVTIDNTLIDFKPTYIKMDIEGAELNAIHGAEQTLKLHAPDLAICVYHLPNHIWEIPQYIDSLKLGYKFYLRNYLGSPLETVMYATVQR